MTFEELWNQVEPYITGLWKYRLRGQPTMWCTTIYEDGHYIDTPPAATPREALELALKDIQSL